MKNKYKKALVRHTFKNASFQWEHMKGINKIKGLRFHSMISQSQKEQIKVLEDAQNSGVFACLQKRRVFIISHNSSFRDPLVFNKDGSFVFAPQPFPEFNDQAIMSSPSKKVHDFLIKEYNLSLNPTDATLLVGVDEQNA